MMSLVEAEPGSVIGGIDTHAETIAVAVVDHLGRQLGDAEFATSPSGYAGALAFVAAHGRTAALGIEGTSSYGAGIAAAAARAGIEVREVSRPDRSSRRSRGKSDPLDAYAAAHAVLAGRATAAAKNEQIAALRALHNARRSALKARQGVQAQIQQQLIIGPAQIRQKYRHLSPTRLITALASTRPGNDPENLAGGVLLALKHMARRHQSLSTEITDLTHALRTHVQHTAPHLLALHGLGTITATQLLITAGNNPDRLHREASFAALCGTAPVPASSGKTTRHRLSRGGDRHANNALHTIAVVRMGTEPRTRAYTARHRERGRSNPEILRQLKRAIAREIFTALTRTPPTTNTTDLRTTRTTKNITMTTAANALGISQMSISRIERGQHLTPELSTRYRDWLQTA